MVWFQQISTLAGNLVPSYFAWEVLFTMAIIGLGLLLFALLIGNMQNFLQALGRRYVVILLAYLSCYMLVQSCTDGANILHLSLLTGDWKCNLGAVMLKSGWAIGGCLKIWEGFSTELIKQIFTALPPPP